MKLNALDPDPEELGEGVVVENGAPRTFESDEETMLGGESACEEDEEYFERLRVSFVADTDALSEMIGRGIFPGR